MQPSPAVQTDTETVASGSGMGLGLIDTHAHLQFSQYSGQVPALLHRAQEAGVERIITVGVNSADSQAATELAAQYENVWATVGVHPHDAGEAAQSAAYIKELAGRRKVVAIGECGFDFYRSKTTPEEQEAAVRLQVEIAQELELPVVFHVREAFERFFTVLADYPGLRGVVHSFTGTEAEAAQAVEAGLYLALNGIMTFTKEEAQLAAARQIPADRLLLETDCPFLSPASQRGKTNEPAWTVEIAEFLAELRGVSPAQIAQSTTHNAELLFGL